MTRCVIRGTVWDETTFERPDIHGDLLSLPSSYSCALADNFRLDDRALFCCDGTLVTDSQPFGRPDSGHRSSPWFKTALRLHTVDSARDRYRIFAASEWERIHASPPTSWIDDEGHMHEQPRPANPYAAETIST